MTSSSLARRSSRDESAFYQAEAAMLTRENQMLQMRIRELERQLNELSSAASNNNTAISVSEAAAATPATGENETIGNTASARPAACEEPEASEKT